VTEQTGVELITAERSRQIEQESWTSEHDDQHTRGELARAGAVYAMPANGSWKATKWPFEPESIKHDWPPLAPEPVRRVKRQPRERNWGEVPF
jgi:hypothetical protein